MNSMNTSPLSQDEARPPAAQEGRVCPRPSETSKILVVDDDKNILEMLNETLGHAGYETRAVADGFQALEALKQEAFAIVLTDNRMPGMSGVELLVEARKLQPEATRLVITGVLELDDVIGSINKGEVYRFIVKPWLSEELLNSVGNAMQRFKLAQQNAGLQAQTLRMNNELRELNASLERQMTRFAAQNEHLEWLNQALKENLNRSVELGVHLLQAFSPVLANQARRAHEVCKTLGASLQLTEESQKTLEIAALLHDIGLVGLDRQMIRKWQEEPERLTEAERSALENHPMVGQELTGFVQNLEDVGAIIRSHHEHYDGTGYPDQLRSDQIPWLGRLLAVVVGFAETGAPRSEAIEIIQRGSGTRYDPDAVRALIRALPKAALPKQEREVLLRELEAGMVLASGVFAANGMLLIPEGQRLSESQIGKLIDHNQVNPITQSLLVYC